MIIFLLRNCLNWRDRDYFIKIIISSFLFVFMVSVNEGILIGNINNNICYFML